MKLGHVVIACLAFSGCATAAPARMVDLDGVEVYGQAQFDWALRTLDDEPISFQRYRGEVLFLNLWASWCVPCVAELRGIESLRESMRGEDVEFLLVSPEGPEPVEEFLRRYGYDLPVAVEASEMPSAFGLRALPTTFVLDRQGRIVLRHQGSADWDQEPVRAFLRALAAT